MLAAAVPGECDEQVTRSRRGAEISSAAPCRPRLAGTFQPMGSRNPNHGGAMAKRGLVGAVVAVLLTVAVSGGAETPTEKRLRQLEETLRQTQDELRELHRQLDQQKAIGQATQKQVEQTAEETRTATTDATKA